MLGLVGGIGRVGSVSVQPVSPTQGVLPIQPKPAPTYVPRTIVPPPPEILTYGPPAKAAPAVSGLTPIYAPAPSGNIPEYTATPSSVARQSIQKLA